MQIDTTVEQVGGENMVADEAQVEEPVAVTSHATVSRDQRETVGDITHPEPRMVCRDVQVWYGDKHEIGRASAWTSARTRWSP